MLSLRGATNTIAKLQGQETLSAEERKRLKVAKKKSEASSEILDKLQPEGDDGLYQARVIAALKVSHNLPAELGGGNTAMVLGQRQLHQSSSSMEDGFGLSYCRRGRWVMALGICTEQCN